MYEGLRDILSRVFLGNPVQDWLIAVGIALVVRAVLGLVRKHAGAVVARLASRKSLIWDGLVSAMIPKTRGLFLAALAVLAGSQFLDFPDRAERTLKIIIGVVAIVQVGIWGNTAIRHYVQTHRARVLKDDPGSVSTIGALGLLAQVVLWVLVILMLLANAGIEIGPLVAGLGVGGIAMALAVQTVLKDLLASLSIMFDKPFVVGDFMIIGDLLGVVEKIGLKTTRVRSLWGEQLIFSNNDLIESRIRNFGRMKERRIAFKVGVTYQTPREKLQKVPGIFKTAVEMQKLTRFDRAHFFEYGNFSLNFEIVYYLGSPDYNLYMDTQQAINLYVHEQFEQEGIEFAYPTQTVFVASQAGEPSLTGGRN